MSECCYSRVWDALQNTPADADIMIAIRDVIDRWDVTQAQAAKRLGVTQPRMNDLLRGRIDKFSLDALINLAMAAGLTVTWRIARTAA
jgi:predicted XRE-type DNA-binding protein